MKENKVSITIPILINAPVATVWEFWNNPNHITGWAFASDDWEAVDVENDLRVGGRFKTRMQSKDGTEGFDFEGIYDVLEEQSRIKYTLSDGRKVSVEFESIDSDKTRVSETFELENENSEEVQREGWQAILENFKKYTEKM